MQLTTPVSFPDFPFRIGFSDHVLALGSCFAERVGRRLEDTLFPATLNPLGTLYNPCALATALQPRLLQPDLFLHEGLWRSFAAHSDLADRHLPSALENLRRARAELDRALATSRLLLLTLGTAQVFELRGTGQPVANCHRLPQALFRRRRLSLEDCLQALGEPLRRWLDEDSSRHVLLTVSPVRYLRDGLIENSRGKSVLLLCCAALEDQLERAHYFPAYEFVLDELRDYRFFAADMTQPSEVTVELVWERFRQHLIEPSLAPALQEVTRLGAARRHRFRPGSDPRPLARSSLRTLERLQARCPQIPLDGYRTYFENLLQGGNL